MCGIAGFVESYHSAKEKHEQLTAMTDAIVHRGPNASGAWVCENNKIALGHRRLSIQDLSAAGAQPMHSHSGRYTIVFNGEIYNFQELIPALTSLGHTFKGHSDTEVLLAAIEAYGLDEALSLCSGMFAFALWDNTATTLQLVRDRIGEKPLYYGWVKKAGKTTFIFASELKAIIAYTGKGTLNIDRSALTSYLRYGYVPTPYSIYENIYKLDAGKIFTLDFAQNPDSYQQHTPPNTASHFRSYWSVSDVVAQAKALEPRSEQELCDDLEEKLKTSVSRQLISDVSLGSFLSGGIDSSLITALAADVSTQKIDTYTVGFDQKQFDEAGFAKEVSDHIGTHHHELYLNSKDALDCVPELPQLYDEPFANASQIPTYLVSKFASKHVTVCLAGDGGDELFAGYNRYTVPEKLFSKTQNIPKGLLKLSGKVLDSIPEHIINSAYNASQCFGKKMNRQANVDLKLQKIAQFFQNPDKDDYYNYLLSFCHTPEDLVINGKEGSLAHATPSPAVLNNNFIEKAQFRDQLTYLADDCLAKVDRASMAVGLEVRAPLLSPDIIELSWQFPTEIKVKQGKTKWPLRNLLYRYVPDSMIERPKMGFTVPIAEWLRQDLQEWAHSFLNTKTLEEDGLFHVEHVMQCWHDHLNRKRNHANLLWAILMFLAWKEMHY